MHIPEIIYGAAAGALAGIFFTWLVMRARRAVLADRLASATIERETVRTERDALRGELSDRSAQFARLESALEQEREKSKEMAAFAQAATATLKDTFKGLSADTLAQSSQQFLQLARSAFESFHVKAAGDLAQRQKAVEEIVRPVKEALDKVNTQVAEVEKSRKQAYGSLTATVEALLRGQKELSTETGNLVSALRKPMVRGRWGEIQLRRVVEFAGMLPHCDFVEQSSVKTETGTLRPDLLVRLPGGKLVVVDSKAPLEAYLSAVSAEDEATRKKFMAEHTRHLRNHIQQLSDKAYWEQFDQAPDFVVLFLPGEPFFSAALEQDEGLIEFGVTRRIILASPTTLITLLQAVSYGWQQEQIAENARHIQELGADLYRRISRMADHFGTVGKSLDRAVKSYNDAVGSLEARVLPAARRFSELDSSIKSEIPKIEPVNVVSREISAPELIEPPEEEDET